MNYLIPLMVVIPILAALIVNILGGKDKTVKAFSIIVGLAIPIIAILAAIGVQYFGGHDPGLLANSLPSNLVGTLVASYNTGIVYIFDNIERIFIFLMGIVAFLSIFTYFTEKKEVSGPYLYLIFMGLASVIALLLSNDIFNMYVFFEITALTQVGIIVASSTEDNYEIALKYLILGSIGGPMLLLGVGFVLGTIGSVNITDIIYAISNNFVDPYSPGLVIGFALILFGWLYSAGLPPFHTIKSAVYSKARPNGSAILQGFSVLCMLAFGIAMYKIFAYIPGFNTAIIVFAILAMVLSIAMSAMEVDFRRMIAFLAVGELGFIALGFGIGTQMSIAAALFQAANEIVITAMLFIGFGSIYYLTNTSDTRKLGGLIGVDSLMGVMILLGGCALAGVPPFNGFVSKLMLVQAALEAGYTELAILAVIVSVVIFFTFVKAFHSVFLEPKPKDLKFVNEKIPRVTVFSVAVLLIICLALGLFPNIVTDVFIPFAGGLI
ncbi:energy-converting hydrogenase B subunit F EhbF [Methanobrevibacter ruminantium M1]|uniref:Energy-converting hydrogenase B subunit F EhbF n=1 Tax=Methanobrevibacter ruminantium (strain ATCC 35063 / DSM 1093 / JCM 13430 / OCM 146 / M1) TaxID=634498 RepID=D3E0D5_METRM|nr:energy conserving hydrogenase EhbF [Methanobrevibacter ruminantium]ADC47859.1 energy-converting hydrogenase B subunit F EhbF [Methanobrevibacter ruminantium M1]